jgi:hypothetical protein
MRRETTEKQLERAEQGTCTCPSCPLGYNAVCGHAAYDPEYCTLIIREADDQDRPYECVWAHWPTDECKFEYDNMGE